MFDTILGLPIHPLLVHFVVVLFPIWALYLFYVLRMKRFAKMMNLNFVVSIVMLIMAIATSQAGDALTSRVGVTNTHSLFGHLVELTAFGLFVAFAGSKLLYNRVGSGLKRFAELSVALGAILALVFTVAAGHTGPSAAWKNKISQNALGTYGLSPTK